MSLLQTPPQNNGTSAEPAGKPEAFWPGFTRTWKRVVRSPYFWVPVLIVELIVPLFYESDAPVFNARVAVLGLGVLLAAISIVVFLYTGAQRVKYYLELPQKLSEMSNQYHELERSIPDLIDSARSTTARQLLALASLPHSPDEIPIAEISEQHGTVHLLLRLPAAPQTFMGMRLTVSTRAEGALWGVVEITRIDDNIGYAAPVDRVNPEFWDHLEERMRRDPSPPMDMVVKTEMHDVLAQLKRALRGEEVTSNE